MTDAPYNFLLPLRHLNILRAQKCEAVDVYGQTEVEERDPGMFVGLLSKLLSSSFNRFHTWSRSKPI